MVFAEGWPVDVPAPSRAGLLAGLHNETVEMGEFFGGECLGFNQRVEGAFGLAVGLVFTKARGREQAAGVKVIDEDWPVVG